MALETLAGLTEIGGFKVARPGEYENEYIVVNDQDNVITFKIQQGPIKEHGVNGCQIDTLIETARIMICKLDEKYPCIHNKVAARQLEAAMRVLNERRIERERRGVEGTSQA